MPARSKWLPVVDSRKCTGCGLCIAACGPACLKVENNIAVLINPNSCGSEEHCIPVCKDEAIKMDWVLTWGEQNIGKWRAI